MLNGARKLRETPIFLVTPMVLFAVYTTHVIAVRDFHPFVWTDLPGITVCAKQPWISSFVRLVLLASRRTLVTAGAVLRWSWITELRPDCRVLTLWCPGLHGRAWTLRSCSSISVLFSGTDGFCLLLCPLCRIMLETRRKGPFNYFLFFIPFPFRTFNSCRSTSLSCLMVAAPENRTCVFCHRYWQLGQSWKLLTHTDTQSQTAGSEDTSCLKLLCIVSVVLTFSFPLRLQFG